MATRIVKATEDERRAYHGVYPLHGWVTTTKIPSRLAVEYCGGNDGDPKYEVIAPEGFHFDPEGLHTLLCTTQRDIRDRLYSESLEACGEDC